MKEVWKPIKDFPGYEISSNGRVRSFRPINGQGKMSKTPRPLKPSLDLDGYPQVIIMQNTKRVCRKIHRLVLMAFIPNHKRKAEVNHISGIKDDNRVENLEWVTSSENQKHAFDTGLQTKQYGSKSSNAKLTEKQVRKIKSYLKTGRTHKNIAADFNVTPANITSINLGKTWGSI